MTSLPSMLDGAFVSPDDHAAFVRLRDGESATPIVVRPLAMGARPIHVRSADDAAKLERVLIGGDHLLPIQKALRVQKACIGGTGLWPVCLDDAVHTGGTPVPPDSTGACPTIVHLGCGPGYLLARLAYQDPSARLIGVDASAESARAARSNMSTFDHRVTIVHACMGAASMRRVVSDQAITHDLESLLEDCGVNVADAIIADPEACTAIVGARHPTLRRIGQVCVRCPDAASAALCRKVLEDAGLVCSADQWYPHGVLAWGRALAAGRERFPQPQDAIDPGPGLW